MFVLSTSMGQRTLFARDVAAKAQPSLHSLLSEAVYTKVAVDWRQLFKYCTLSAAFHIHAHWLYQPISV